MSKRTNDNYRPTEHISVTPSLPPKKLAKLVSGKLNKHHVTEKSLVGVIVIPKFIKWLR